MQPFWDQGQYLKNTTSKTIADLINYTIFQIYRAYPAGFIWKIRKLTTNIDTKKSNYLYIK